MSAMFFEHREPLLFVLALGFFGASVRLSLDLFLSGVSLGGQILSNRELLLGQQLIATIDSDFVASVRMVGYVGNQGDSGEVDLRLIRSQKSIGAARSDL